MKVICIDDTNENSRCPNPVLGETYTVVDEGRVDKYEYYQFAEIPPVDNRYFWYLKNRFIPLSSISETEFTRNYNTEKV